jgi:hypothetical protein
MLAGVDSSTVRFLGIAFTRELGEEQALAFLNLAQALVDAALGEQTVHLQFADLSHPVPTATATCRDRCASRF